MMEVPTQVLILTLIDTEPYFPTTSSKTLAEIDSSFTTHYKIPDLTGITFVGGNMWMTGVIANGKMYTWGKESEEQVVLDMELLIKATRELQFLLKLSELQMLSSFSKPEHKEQCFVLLNDSKIMSWGVGENNWPDSETPVELSNSYYDWAGGERATFILRSRNVWNIMDSVK